jgi:hypothetical protein
LNRLSLFIGRIFTATNTSSSTRDAAGQQIYIYISKVASQIHKRYS